MDTFEKYIHTENITFKYAKGASIMSGREFHPYNEIIYFMGERAVLFSEKGQLNIKPDTVIVIPKETYHQLSIIGNAQSYMRCIINFGDIAEFKCLTDKAVKNLYTTDAQGVKYLFEKLIKLADKRENTEVWGTVLKAVLALILNEVENVGIKNNTNPLVSDAVSYITHNISKNLCIDDIACQLNVSASTLTHTFKKEMNIPLHKYILKKRLAMAYEKISSGAPAFIAASECGFFEYSNFYRQYKKMFGISPSQKEYKLQTQKQI